jgi:hypothetical protein
LTKSIWALTLPSKTMKYIFAILASLLLLLQPLAKLWVVVDFGIHQAQWAKTLCVKKAEKNNCCQARCQLAKNLKSTESSQEKSGLPMAKPKFELLLAILHDGFSSLMGLWWPKQKLFIGQNMAKTDGFITLLEHPPAY